MNNLDPIIAIAILLSLALVGGMVAHRLRQPVMVGYLLIGVAVGPNALGLVRDVAIIESAAAIGVALLMFTLGLEISISQLREVGKIGIWGGVLQIAGTMIAGMAAGLILFHWPLLQSMLFGLIISLSSTAVCLKVLMERGELSSVHGRIMISMLILQDLAVVLMIVAMPFIVENPADLPLDIALAIGKSILFIGIAIVLGRWVLPWLLGNIGGVRARELFLLTVLVLCLGAAVSTQAFGFSMVFGAFLVGLILRETRFVHQALAEITPLRDVFATLFFVSLGMLLNPFFVAGNWPYVLLVVAVIILLKAGVVFGIVSSFGYGKRIALIAGSGLFQIGEFGFILAQQGLKMQIVSEEFHSVILASAVITMLLTPFSLSLAVRLYPLLPAMGVKKARGTDKATSLSAGNHASPDYKIIIAGYGRVGQSIARGMEEAGIPYLVIDFDPERLYSAREDKKPGLYGDATNVRVLSQAGLEKAEALVITYPDPMAVVTTAKLALGINPGLNVLARVHRNKEVEELKRLGVQELISPEYEASVKFIKRLLNISGVDRDDRKQILASIRRNREIDEFDPDQSV
jgi:monovalent cation:H+ antiporter-2, CPA2 family